MAPPRSALTRLGLTLNAWFSLVNGLVLSLAPSTVGGWLSVDIDPWLRLYGLALVAHFGILVWVTRQAQVEQWTKINLFIVAPYPLMMIGVVAAGLVDSGYALVLLDGAAVGLFALMQWSGLRNMNRMSGPELA